jgi:hypothetical protein
MKKSQMSLELALVIGFMLIVLTVFVSFISSKVVDIKKEKDTKILQDLTNVIKSEIDLAAISENGYRRTFQLPPKLDGADYTIKYDNGTSTGGKFTILTTYYNGDPGNEVVIFVAPKIFGSGPLNTINKGSNTITKSNGYVVFLP